MSKPPEKDPMGAFLRKTEKQIRAMHPKIGADKARFWARDFQRKEDMLLLAAVKNRPLPFGGTLDAFMTTRAVLFFGTLAHELDGETERRMRAA